MMHLRNLLSLLLISSCANVPDVIICRQVNPSSAFCTHTISDTDIVIDDTHLYNNKTWIDEKLETVIVPVESWSEIKKYIIKKCKQNKDCNSQIGKWQSKVDKIN